MKFGIYGTNAHVTVGSQEIAEAIEGSRLPLPSGSQDKQFEFGLDVLTEADKVGFDIILFAERHLGPDLTTWVVAGAIGSRLERMRSMVAVHPGLWHPTLVAKLAVTLDRLCKGGMAINIVTGANEAEFQMFGGTAMLNDNDRYVRATEFIEILKGMWTQPVFSLEGKFYKVRNAELRLAPRNPTPPEIFTAARSDGGRDMIARVGDWWFLDYPKTVQSTDEMLRSLEASMTDMRRRMTVEGRTVRFAFNPFINLGADDESALESAVSRITKYDKEPDSKKVRVRMLPAALGGCIGKPEKVRRQIRRFADMGIELLLFKMAAGKEDVREIGREIVEPLGSRQEAAGVAV
ncbi:MAG: LLM class flavin-dependent oxidoreductase [Beijerinckiaceae bacterium]